MDFPNLPYSAIIIDSSYSHLSHAANQCIVSHGRKSREDYQAVLQRLWTASSTPNHVLPCLCVRSALDLYLQAKNYPPGSEVIMSAINIQDMAQIVRHHGLKIVPVDINMDTVEPDIHLLESLITSRTVALLLAHLYGRWIEMKPFIALAKKYNLSVIEDCAECFCGFSRTGHPDTDLSMFSFGVIKFSTCFGGAIAKVRDDDVHRKMCDIMNQYPFQTGGMYLKKIMKYSLMFTILQQWPFPQFMQMSRQMGKDWKDTFVSFIRGFPDKLIDNIRYQPSSALLAVMAHTHCSFNQSKFDLQRIKGDYLLSHLKQGLRPVGTKVKVNNFWLFPVVMHNTDLFVSCLGALGVDAYRGATQLRVIEPDNVTQSVGPNLRWGQMVSAADRYPRNARYLIDHVVYMPVNKFVPFHVLDQMVHACDLVVGSMSHSRSRALSICKSVVKSKL